MDTTKDYYEILQVSVEATTAQIRYAYRKLATQHHPDKNNGSRASEALFKEVVEAYSVLSNVEKRKNYDQQRSGVELSISTQHTPVRGKKRKKRSSANKQASNTSTTQEPVLKPNNQKKPFPKKKRRKQRNTAMQAASLSTNAETQSKGNSVCSVTVGSTHVTIESNQNIQIKMDVGSSHPAPTQYHQMSALQPVVPAPLPAYNIAYPSVNGLYVQPTLHQVPMAPGNHAIVQQPPSTGYFQPMVAVPQQVVSFGPPQPAQSYPYPFGQWYQ